MKKPRVEMLGGSQISKGAAEAANAMGNSLAAYVADAQAAKQFNVASHDAMAEFCAKMGWRMHDHPLDQEFEINPVALLLFADSVAAFALSKLDEGNSDEEHANGWALLLACRQRILPPTFIQTILAGMNAAADEEPEPIH